MRYRVCDRVYSLTDSYILFLLPSVLWQRQLGETAETTDFSGLDKFNKSVSNMFLLNFCQVNFVWISPCDTETYIICFYVISVHDSIAFIIAMFNCFITLLQHVRGQSALCCQINVCMYVCRMAVHTAKNLAPAVPKYFSLADLFGGLDLTRSNYWNNRSVKHSESSSSS